MNQCRRATPRDTKPVGPERHRRGWAWVLTNPLVTLLLVGLAPIVIATLIHGCGLW